MDVNEIIDSMSNDGYFGNLDDETNEWNYINRLNKARLWLSNGIYPSWFKNDLLKYQPDKNNRELLMDT